MRQRLFSTQRYLHRRHDIVVPPETAKGRREWVISRALCHYQLFSLTDIPANRQEQVLQLKIQQWSPFAEYGSYAVWQNEQVQVWIWDKQVPEHSWVEIGIKKATLLPETVLRSRPKADDIQLIQCLEGVEGQIWRGGLLVGSRWWSEVPKPAEWLLFQRAYGLAAQPNIPTPLEGDLLNRPWGRVKTKLDKLAFLYKESFWLNLAAAIFMVILTWQAVSIFKWQNALNLIQEQIAELNDQITPILTARNQAFADKKRFEQLITLDPYPTQLELMATAAEQLTKNKAHFVNWTYQLGELRFTIKAEQQLDPTWYIKTFQSQPFFQDVKAEAFDNSKQLILKMHVKTN